MRRNGSRFGRRGTSGLPPISAATVLAGAHTRLRADTGFTAGATATWVDMISGTRTFAQATAAAQPTLAPTFANLGNRAALTCDGGDSMQYTGAAADYAFIHQGPYTFMTAVYTPPASSASVNTLFATGTGTIASTAVGARVSLTNASAANGTALNYSNGSLWSTMAYPSAAWICHRCVSTPPGTNIVRASGSGGFANSSTYANAPGGTPDVPMIIMSSTDNRTLQNGSAVAEMIWWARALTDREVAAIAAYFVGRYGVVA